MIERIKLFSDGADKNGIIKSAEDNMISGFTTNPTLMKQAGITDYKSFSLDIISYLSKNRPDTSLSLEVFADEPNEMYQQAKIINSWGENFNYPVYVKIPIMTTNGNLTIDLIKKLHIDNVKINITAVFTFSQVYQVCNILTKEIPSIISIFAGRIADTGTDPKILIKKAAQVKDNPKTEILWASPREAYNYYDAFYSGADIITMTPDLISKVKKFGKDLNEFSKETVQMFYNDALASGYKID
jgi:transaldolase